MRMKVFITKDKEQLKSLVTSFTETPTIAVFSIQYDIGYAEKIGDKQEYRARILWGERK